MFPSVTVTVTVKVPLTAKVCIGFCPETVGVLSPKFQLNVKGAVPPDADAMNETGLPAVGLVGLNVKLTINAWGDTETVVWLDTVWWLASVTDTATVKGPLTAKVVVKLGPEPVDGLPFGADQEIE